MTLTFASNEAYLEWEMTRWRAQLDALLEATEGGVSASSLAEYHVFAATSLDTRIEAVKAREAAMEAGVVIPFALLSSGYGLSLAEEALLLLGLSQHLSAPVWERVLRAQSGRIRGLEMGFAVQLVNADAVLTRTALLEPGAPLLRSGMVMLAPAPNTNGFDAGRLAELVQVPRYIASSVMGRMVLDDRLVSCCQLTQPQAQLYELIVNADAQRKIDAVARALHGSHTTPLEERGWRVLITGARAVGKSMLAEALARLLEKPLFVIHANLLAHQPDAAQLFELAMRNAQMLGALVLLSEPERWLESRPALVGHVVQLIREYRGLLCLEVQRAEVLSEDFEPLIDDAIELSRPESPARQALWERFLPAHIELEEGLDLGVVGAQYELTGGQIEAAMTWACQRAGMRRGGRLHQDDLVAGARTQLRSKLGQYAEASRVRLGMESLVLPEQTLTEVTSFLEACRHRARVMNHWGFGRRLATGRGLVALFAGEAGTGKTLTSEILANELDLKLHIVSIPKIVSKWVGETEKNVREVFSQARASDAVLLFDEADSLFAKRVKVERAQDHFQNMEVNNLLQEIERFDGIVILTTNLEVNMDRAFARRILFKIDFPEPGPEERSRIWKTLLPREAPIAPDIDFEALGEVYELTGGQIKNAIVRAAYACASSGRGLDEDALHEAAEQQIRAAGKLVRSVE